MAKRDFGQGTTIIWKDRKRWCGLPWSFTRYYIVQKSNRWTKLIIDKGLLHTNIEEINLFRVHDISVMQTFTNKFWGTGSLTIYAEDESSRTTDNNREGMTQIIRVKNPRQLRNLINELLEDDRRSRNVAVGEMHL